MLTYFRLCRNDYKFAPDIAAHNMQLTAALIADMLSLRQLVVNYLNRQILRQLVRGQPGALAVMLFDLNKLRLGLLRSGHDLGFVE